MCDKMRAPEQPALNDSPTADEGVGRIKAPPVCEDAVLKQTAMSAADLSQWTYPVPVTELPPPQREAAIPVSSSSSTCTRDSEGALSDAEWGKVTPVRLEREVSKVLNAKVSLQKTSRQGRSTQRWETDSETNEAVRLVTGCVPILQSGKILFVSASRKAEWILPKGGWEKDEKMEESAVRECFEEAGVLGTLGPKLSVFQYETRKAKKRRLEMEEFNKQKKVKADTESVSGDISEGTAPTDNVTVVEAVEGETKAPAVAMSDEVISRIREASSKPSDDCTSTASGSYSQVRMTLFPLYVSSALEKWPESGRFRKAVDIDEAIRMTEGRPEFKAALVEVKERGLHLVTDPHKQTSC